MRQIKVIPENELVCIKCFEHLSLTPDGYLCSRCSSSFPIRDGVHIFNDQVLDSHKLSEDEYWNTRSGPLAANEPAWKILVNKADMIKSFSRHALPLIKPEGRILELGAGSGWASSVIKSEFPQCKLYASDVSLAAMRKARALSEICGDIDYFVACDSEKVPFADGLFDRAFSVAFLHHFNTPVNVLKQIRRILRPGGIYVAFGEIMTSRIAKPIYRHFSNQASRSDEIGVIEQAFGFRQWGDFFKSAGFEDPEMELYKEPGFRRNVAGSFYYAFANRIPDSLVKSTMFSTILISTVRSG